MKAWKTVLKIKMSFCKLIGIMYLIILSHRISRPCIHNVFLYWESTSSARFLWIFLRRLCKGKNRCSPCAVSVSFCDCQDPYVDCQDPWILSFIESRAFFLCGLSRVKDWSIGCAFIVYTHIQSWICSFQTATSGVSSLARLPWGSKVSSEIAEVAKNRDTLQAIQIYEFGKYLLHFTELCLSLKGFLRTTVWTIDLSQGYVSLPSSLNLLSVIVYTFANERWPTYIVLGLALSCLFHVLYLGKRIF